MLGLCQSKISPFGHSKDACRHALLSTSLSSDQHIACAQLSCAFFDSPNRGSWISLLSVFQLQSLSVSWLCEKSLPRSFEPIREGLNKGGVAQNDTGNKVCENRRRPRSLPDVWKWTDQPCSRSRLDLAHRICLGGTILCKIPGKTGLLRARSLVRQKGDRAF